MHWLIPALVMLPVLWALLPGGLPDSADGMVHFTRITEIVASWRDGILIPRWSLNLGFGYGVPVFIFGPPLAYWLGALYNIAGFGPEAAYKAMLVTVLALGTTGSYRLGQALFGVWAGAVAATAYLYAPNQLFTLFVQGNAPQLLAWSCMAWALWATVQLFHTQQLRRQRVFALALALAVSGTLISHNVVTLILVPTIGALALTLWVGTRAHRALALTVAGGALGGLLSAWFVLPALLETVYASTDAIFAFDYGAHFVPLSELLAWPPRLDAGAINPYIPRTLGLPHVIVAGVGALQLMGAAVVRAAPGMPASLATFWGRARQRPAEMPALPALDQRVVWATAIFMTGYALVCGWMATRWSAPLWEVIPLLEFLQFPARWIGFAGFALAWLAAAGIALWPRRIQPYGAAALCLALIGTALVNLYPDKTPVGTRAMSPYDVVRYELRSGAIGTTSYGEFNPRWAPRPLPPSPMVEDYMARRPVDRLKGMLPVGASHTILNVNAHRQQYAVTLTQPATITVNLLYFPGWRATVNGAPVPLAPQASTGLITVALPAGESELDLVFGPTPLRRAAGIVSVAAWVVLLAAAGALLMRAPDPSPPPQATPAFTYFTANTHPAQLAPLAVAILLALALQIGGEPWFELRSAPDQALTAPVPRHEDVGAQFRLLGQNAMPDTVRAGATLPIVAYWRALDDTDTNYAVVLRVVDVAEGQVLVEAEQRHPNNIPTSGWATGLYVRNEWQLTIPAAALPIQYAVHTGFRDPSSGALLPTTAGDTVELGRLWVTPRQPPQPPADGPRAHFGTNIELVGVRTARGSITFYWRATTPIAEAYSIFVHLLDENGAMVGQADGLPYGNRYPTWAWRPGQIIEDRRDLVAAGFDPARLHTVAVGIYVPATETRLTARAEDGAPLAHDALMIPWAKE